ncbi:hypothetical protein C0993_011420 [Termitomyces sp. T159_Od127]|nr:hypothetical protein C0993_011420 [Termitomyces sp. T159_Od127]
MHHNTNSQLAGQQVDPAKTGKHGNMTNHTKNFRTSFGCKANNVPGNSFYNGESDQKFILSKEEKDEHHAMNKCFQCSQEGHFAHNCPSKGKAKSNTGKPPGISAFSIQLDLARTKQCYNDTKEYDSDGDTIPDLQLVTDSDSEPNNLTDSESTGSAEEVQNELMDETDWSEDDKTLLAPPMPLVNPYWMPVESAEEKLVMLDVDLKRKCLGDPAGNKLEELLEGNQSYPGDLVNVLQFRGRRFVAFMAGSNEIIMHDKVFDNFEIINRSLVECKHYALGEWYANIHSQQTGAPLTNQSFYGICLLAEPVASGITQLASWLMKLYEQDLETV